jgi:hypothetical protein
MKKYIKIKKANLEPDKYGKHIKITMIGLYDENDKWLKWVTLNDALLDYLLQQKIELL